MVGSTPPLFQVFKKTGGLVWKRIAMNHTRRANAKDRHRRIRQVRGSQADSTLSAAREKQETL